MLPKQTDRKTSTVTSVSAGRLPAQNLAALAILTCPDHCIETLRLNLMCQSDIGVFTFHDFPELVEDGIEGDWSDFETQHMCRNFEAIRKWTNANAVAFTHDV
jgi:hypothetical protein